MGTRTAILDLVSWFEQVAVERCVYSVLLAGILKVFISKRSPSLHRTLFPSQVNNDQLIRLLSILVFFPP